MEYNVFVIYFSQNNVIFLKIVSDIIPHWYDLWNEIAIAMQKKSRLVYICLSLANKGI